MAEQNSPRRRAVRQRLESLQQAGVNALPRASARLPAPGPTTTDSAEPTSKEPTTMASTARPRAIENGPPRDTASPPVDGRSSVAPTLEVLAQEVAACTLCDELASTRTQTVFGVGDPRARLCFMGEAPGADEDQQGEPFVGRAGKLLNKIIEACGLRREDVYILNTLKCRPPGNRIPTPTESQNCRPFLNRQLELIEPEFICCLGAVAAQNLLETTVPIGKLRGSVHAYRGIKVVCTYHPAYLLRNPAAKKPTWEDMQMLLGEMGLKVPGSA
jgi:DNA polymerase